MKYLFIFALMSIVGWVLETVYRSIAARNFINPGLMLGIALPIYGIGGIILNILSTIRIVENIHLNYFLLSIISAFILTFLELIGGILLMKIFNIKLWDYSHQKLNYKGLICLKMAILWGFISYIYFAFLNQFVNEITIIFINNELSILLLGIFVGIFVIDSYFSCKLLLKIKKYSIKQKEIINLELLKLQVRKEQANLYALKKIFYLLYPYKNIHEFILQNEET